MNNDIREISSSTSEVNNIVQGAGEGRRKKTNKGSRGLKRVKGRKRTVDGELASGSQWPSGSHNMSEHSENERVEVIDVEKLKDSPWVDLTKDCRNDVYVDLTRELPSSPNRPLTSLSTSVICISPIEKTPQKNNDIVVVNPNTSKRTEDVPANDSDDSITCAICIDSFEEIKKQRRQLMSTICGHVFCDTCLMQALSSQSKCPTCRRKITKKQLHPIFL